MGKLIDFEQARLRLEWSNADRRGKRIDIELDLLNDGDGAEKARAIDFAIATLPNEERPRGAGTMRYAALPCPIETGIAPRSRPFPES